MAESTRPRGATGAGGGGSGRGPVPPSAGASPRHERPAVLIEAVLRDRRDDDLARRVLRARGDLRLPHGVLLTCEGSDGDAPATTGRAIAGRIPRSTLIRVDDAEPPHAAVVVPVGSPDAWRHALRVAEAEAAPHECLVLVRPPVTGLRALRSEYFRALSDAGLARAGGTAGPLVMSDALVIPRMLAQLDAADQRALLGPILPVLCLPPPQRSMYLRTLDALRRSGGTLASAAAALDLHVNSLRYRIDRIEEMTGLRVDNPGDRLTIDLAMVLVLLRGDASGDAAAGSVLLTIMDEAEVELQWDRNAPFLPAA